MEPIVFRKAVEADVPALAVMNWQLIRDEGHRNPLTIDELAVRMSGWLAGQYEAVLFEQAGQTIGYALYRRDADYIYLRQMFVWPDYRRRGVGRRAIEWLRRDAWGATPVRVEVLVGNASGLAFWRAMGFDDYCVTLELPAPRAS
jgi:GNAT superfamily N-acetyltransferase